MYRRRALGDLLRPADDGGHIYTIAGGGYGETGTGDGGPPTDAVFYAPIGFAFNGSGNMVIADGDDDHIWLMPATSGTFSVGP